MAWHLVAVKHAKKDKGRTQSVTNFRTSENPFFGQSYNSDLIGLTRRLRIGRLVVVGSDVQISKLAASPSLSTKFG